MHSTQHEEENNMTRELSDRVCIASYPGKRWKGCLYVWVVTEYYYHKAGCHVGVFSSKEDALVQIDELEAAACFPDEWKVVECLVK